MQSLIYLADNSYVSEQSHTWLVRTLDLPRPAVCATASIFTQYAHLTSFPHIFHTFDMAKFQRTTVWTGWTEVLTERKFTEGVIAATGLRWADQLARKWG